MINNAFDTAASQAIESFKCARCLFAPLWRVTITAACSPLADALLLEHSFRMQRDVSFLLQLVGERHARAIRLQKSNDIDITHSMKETAAKFLQAAGARLCAAICSLCLAYLFFLPGLNFQQW